MEDGEDVCNTTPVIAEDGKTAGVAVTEQDSAVVVVVPTAKVKKDKKSKDSGGVNPFKEHPFTFLAPDDPILLNCMSALFFSQSFCFTV